MNELQNFLKQNSIQLVNLHFTNLVGKVHSMTCNANQLSEINFQEKNKLIPDMTTVFNDPFCAQKSATILCNAITSDNLPYPEDSRSVAIKAYDYARSTGLISDILCSFEIEFSIFDQVKFKFNPYDTHVKLGIIENYLNVRKHTGSTDEPCDLVLSTDLLSDIRSEIMMMMLECGIESPLYHKKISAYQGSLRIGNNKFLCSLDNIQKSKYVIQNVANSYGKTATFMPKPIMNSNGQSLRLHQSLVNKTENYSYYIGGVKKHIGAISAFSNSTTNSYKRSINFSIQSGQDEITLPFSDASANPYLCAAAILMAGLGGIQNKINQENIETQPLQSLSEALEALSQDREFLLKAFTNEQIDYYIKLKQNEIREIENSLTPAEFLHYYTS